jgi:predicted amidohydrolase YtcJ
MKGPENSASSVEKAPPGMDLVLFNGQIHTLEKSQPLVEAVAIRGGRIVFLGTGDRARQIGGDDTPAVDLRGLPAFPGFIDSHVHYWRSGLMEQMVDLREARSIAGIQQAMREKAQRVQEGQLLMGRGWSDTMLHEQRYPNRHELDAVAPKHIVYLLHRNGHSCALNSLAIDWLKLEPNAPGVEREPETQRPAGPLREKIAFSAQSKLMTLLAPEVRQSCLSIISQHAVEGGVTTVHCLEGGRIEGDPDVDDFLAHQDELPVSTVLYYQIRDLERVRSLGLPRIGGCVLIDGSPAAHTGALYEPYSDKPETSGPEYWTQKDLNEWVFRCHEAGMQITVHATCERAIGQMLEAYEQALLAIPRANHRHRIDHFYFPTKEQVWKAAQLGVCAGVQPYFAEAFHDMYQQRLGPLRAKRTHPYRWFLDAGVWAGGGSDSFVTPIRPIGGIHAAVNHFCPEQRVSPAEALKMFTCNSAYLGFEEHEAGTLKIGKRGDLAVVSGDILKVAPEMIKNIQVEMTISKGRITYRA